MAIKRIWHGWTSVANAAAYENLLHEDIFPAIEAKKIPGYRSIELLRRDLGDQTEFITVMAFDTLDNVIAFQGADYQRAYVPGQAQRVLQRWDDVSAHFAVREVRRYDS